MSLKESIRDFPSRAIMFLVGSAEVDLTDPRKRQEFEEKLKQMPKFDDCFQALQEDLRGEYDELERQVSEMAEMGGGPEGMIDSRDLSEGERRILERFDQLTQQAHQILEKKPL